MIQNLDFLQGKKFFLSRGDLLVVENKIKEIFPPGKGKGGEMVFDGSEYLGVPAFVNSHIHLLDTLWKEKWMGKTIPQLFSSSGWKARHLQDIQHGKGDAWIPWITKGLKELVRSGIATACVFVEEGIHGIQLVHQGAQNLKIAPHLVLLGRPIQRPVCKKELEKILSSCQGIGLGSTGDFSDEELLLMSRFRHSALLATHIAEFQKTSNFERALSLYGAHFLVHGNYLSPEEWKKLADCQIPVIHSFRASQTFGLDTPDLLYLENLNLLWALATDNLMLNSPNLLREIAFVARALHRLHGNLPPEFAVSLLASITYRPAQILGFSQKGVLEKNFESDILLFRKSPTLLPLENLWTFIFRGDFGDLEYICLQGKLIKRSDIQ
ncbi:MAG: hypothetical protein D6785_02485 [Planctomycetota bacterium]|nr:MAG: hypothetical protein D6785_02485 [Planctomycetota bacterium]